MSTMLLAADFHSQLATAAAHYGIVPESEAQELGATLNRENATAYLWAYFDGPEAIEDWDDLDEDEQDDEELAEVVEALRRYAYRPGSDAWVADRAAVAEAARMWCYQAGQTPKYRELPGWLAVQQLLSVVDPAGASA